MKLMGLIAIYQVVDNKHKQIGVILLIKINRECDPIHKIG